MRLSSILIYIFIISMSLPGYAFLESTTVLPEGINSFSVISGQINNLSQRYSEDGSLGTLSEHNSIEFDMQTLASFNPEINDLQLALNQFGSSQSNFGDKLHLGKLQMNINPTVNFFSPAYAFGLTKDITLAVSIPLISYKNKISMTPLGSNIPAIRELLSGADPELDSAFEQLDVDTAVAVNQFLRDRNYKPLADTRSDFWGDLQLSSLYNFYNSPQASATSKTVLTLPTGPSDDPDDLTDLEGFNKSSIEQRLVVAKNISPKHQLVGALSYKLNLPDRVRLRVPSDKADTLPKQHQTQHLDRDLGDELLISFAGMRKLSSRFGLGLGYEYHNKFANTYAGGSRSQMHILEKNTNSSQNKIELELSYSTVEAYFNKQALLPMAMWLSVSDVFSGLNTERQTVVSAWAMLFF